ncbi:hypothetical protein T4A_8797, partial [Trichinella pseudospiralis]
LTWLLLAGALIYSPCIFLSKEDNGVASGAACPRANATQDRGAFSCGHAVHNMSLCRQQYLGEVLPFLTRMFKDPVRECTRRNHSASWQGGHPQLDRPDIYTAANEASMQHTLH